MQKLSGPWHGEKNDKVLNESGQVTNWLEVNSSEVGQRVGELEGTGFKGKSFTTGDTVTNVNSEARSMPPVQAQVVCEPEPPSGVPQETWLLREEQGF